MIATGTPEEVAEVKGSYTGEFLRKVLAHPVGALCKLTSEKEKAGMRGIH